MFYKGSWANRVERVGGSAPLAHSSTCQHCSEWNWTIYMYIEIHHAAPMKAKPYSSLSHRILKHVPLRSDFVPQGNFLGNVRKALILVPKVYINTH